MITNDELQGLAECGPGGASQDRTRKMALELLARRSGAQAASQAISDELVALAIEEAENAHAMGATVTRPMMRAALEAALALSPAAQGKVELGQVKPLVWSAPSPRHKYKSFDGFTYRADAPASLRIGYEIWHYVDRIGPQFLLRWSDQWFDTLDEAKASATFDYEARIRSALTHPSPPSISAGRDEGLEDAAKIAEGMLEVIPMWERPGGPPGNGPKRLATPTEIAAAIRSAKGSRE